MNLHGLRHNHTSGYYEVTENGITYAMELSEMDMLKRSSERSVADWYLGLPLEHRKKVKRSGNLPHAKNDTFYPDAEYE